MTIAALEHRLFKMAEREKVLMERLAAAEDRARTLERRAPQFVQSIAVTRDEGAASAQRDSILQLSAHQIQHAMRVFNMLDADNSGTIDQDELAAYAVKHAGPSPRSLPPLA